MLHSSCPYFSQNLTYRPFFLFPHARIIQYGGRLQTSVAKGQPAELTEQRLNHPPISAGGAVKKQHGRSDCSDQIVLLAKPCNYTEGQRRDGRLCSCSACHCLCRETATAKGTDLQTSRWKKKEDVTLARPNLEAGSTKITLLSIV